MAKYQYTVEDSHTWVKPSATEQKVKVSFGEIVELDETYQNQARLFVAGFRKVKDDGSLDSTKSNDPKDSSVDTDVLETPEQAKHREEIQNLEGNPVSEVEVEVKDDGKDEITIKVEKPSKKSK